MDVTVVIPAFNAARYIGATIESVLAQTLAPKRVVVVDDGSTDDTGRIVARFGSAVSCVRQENQGVSVARNNGVRFAETSWVAFLDADDLWLPTKLEDQLAAAEKSGLDVSLTALRLVDDNLSFIMDMGTSGASGDLEGLLFHRDSIPHGSSSTLLMKRDLFQAIGGYDETLSTVADWDMLIRLCARGPFSYVAEPLILCRRHAASMSRNVGTLERESASVLMKAFGNPMLPAGVRRLKSRCFAWNDRVLAGSYFQAGAWVRAGRFAARALWRDPTLVSSIAAIPIRIAHRLASPKR